MSKAVIIDGCSLSYMRKPLGLRGYRFADLFSLLTSLGTSAEIWERPVYVSDSNLQRKIGKAVVFAGFTHVVKDGKGEDDKYIIDYIDKLPDEVDEIIIVAADSDFVQALDKRVEKGNKVIVVATKSQSLDGSAMVGWLLQSRFESETFQFIELAEHRLEIGFEWIVDYGRPRIPIRTTKLRLEVPLMSTTPTLQSEVQMVTAVSVPTVVVNPPLEVVKVGLRVELQAYASHEEIVALMASIMGVVQKHPGVRFKITNT